MNRDDCTMLATAQPGPLGEYVTLTLVGPIDVGEHLALWNAFTTFVPTDDGFTAASKSDRVAVRERWLPGPHEVLAIDSRVGAQLTAVVVRRPGAVVATWRDVPASFDYDSASALGPDPMLVDRLPTPTKDRPLHRWVVPLAHRTVFIDDPSGGNQITAQFGFDADKRVAALVVSF